MSHISVRWRFVLFLCAAGPLSAQFGGEFREAIQLDFGGKGSQARELLQRAIDSSASPQQKANAERTMAMSWAFEGNCAKAGEYEQRVIDYWKTQEQANPANAFYQEGEMADEAARVCIDAGDLNSAADWYQKGHESGLKEPNITADRQTLWDFRLEHALARIAARRGNREEAEKHITAAKAALDRMTDLRRQQESFLPYLTGYVAFYSGDYSSALSDFQKANTNDPFIECMIGQTLEKLGRSQEAAEWYKKAAATTAHNPPAAYARPFASSKLESERHR